MFLKNEIKGIPSVQIQETPLSDFFHEVMLYYSKADVVAHQIDNDYARLDTGPIKKKILRTITNMPWEKLQYIRFLKRFKRLYGMGSRIF